VAEGTHGELMATSARYRDLVRHQLVDAEGAEAAAGGEGLVSLEGEASGVLAA
jgi:hypothetical protein